jgi:hypothetical protein
MSRLISRPLLATVLFSLLAACAASEPAPPPPPPAPSMPPATASSAAAVDSAPPKIEEPPAPKLPAVELVEGTDAEAPAKIPTVKLKSPASKQVISVDKKGDFEVKLDVKDWPVPEDKRHVHLILDNQPYKRIDDPKQPIKLKDIAPGYELAEDQQHILVAFASRATHESVKPSGKAIPVAVVPFFIGSKRGEERWKAKDPLLVYSRPKGKNDGPPPADGILVDYYLVNAELGDGKFSLKATLKGPGAEDGKTVLIKSWKPYRIKNARTGTYSLELELLDKDGKPAGAINKVAREFQVDLEAPGDNGGHGPDHAGHGMGDAPKTDTKVDPKTDPKKK